MEDLYTYFNEMQGLYDKFTKHSETLEGNHDIMRATSMAFEQVAGWQKHMKEKVHDSPILDKLQAKTTKVTIDTWEGIYDLMETLINEGQKYCEKRWLDADNSLTYLDFPVLDPIS